MSKASKSTAKEILFEINHRLRKTDTSNIATVTSTSTATACDTTPRVTTTVTHAPTPRVRWADPLTTDVCSHVPRLQCGCFCPQNCCGALANDKEDLTAVDSGASDNLGHKETPGSNRVPCENGIAVIGATGDRQKSVAKDTFKHPLPDSCLDCHVFRKGDSQRPLLLVGEVCDDDINVLFNKWRCHFIKDKCVILTGHRDQRTGLCLLPRTVDNSDLPSCKSCSLFATVPRDDIETHCGHGPTHRPWIGSPDTHSWLECLQGTVRSDFDEALACMRRSPNDNNMDPGHQSQVSSWSARINSCKGAKVLPKKQRNIPGAPEDGQTRDPQHLQG